MALHIDVLEELSHLSLAFQRNVICLSEAMEHLGTAKSVEMADGRDGAKLQSRKRSYVEGTYQVVTLRGKEDGSAEFNAARTDFLKPLVTWSWNFLCRSIAQIQTRRFDRLGRNWWAKFQRLLHIASGASQCYESFRDYQHGCKSVAKPVVDKMTDMNIISIADHKTFTTHGSARVAMLPMHWGTKGLDFMLIVYYQGKMQRIKEQEGVKADSVFFTKTSPIPDSSYLNKRVTKMGKTILSKDKGVTLTLIRKCISLLMLDNFPDRCSEKSSSYAASRINRKTTLSLFSSQEHSEGKTSSQRMWSENLLFSKFKRSSFAFCTLNLSLSKFVLYKTGHDFELL